MLTEKDIKKGMQFVNHSNPYIGVEIVTSIHRGIPYTKVWVNRLGKFTRPGLFGFGMDDLINYLNRPEVEVISA